MATARCATSHPVLGFAPGSFEQVDGLPLAQRQELAQLDPSPDVVGSGRRGSASVGVLAQRSSRPPRACETFRVDDEFNGTVLLWVPNPLRQRQFVLGLLGHCLYAWRRRIARL